MGRDTQDYNEAVKFLLEREQVDTEKRNILISHQFYTAGGETPKTSDSETISVGDLIRWIFRVLRRFPMWHWDISTARSRWEEKVSVTVVRC